MEYKGDEREWYQRPDAYPDTGWVIQKANELEARLKVTEEKARRAETAAEECKVQQERMVRERTTQEKAQHQAQGETLKKVNELEARLKVTEEKAHRAEMAAGECKVQQEWMVRERTTEGKAQHQAQEGAAKKKITQEATQQNPDETTREQLEECRYRYKDMQQKFKDTAFIYKQGWGLGVMNTKSEESCAHLISLYAKLRSEQDRLTDVSFEQLKSTTFLYQKLYELQLLCSDLKKSQEALASSYERLETSYNTLDEKVAAVLAGMESCHRENKERDWSDIMDFILGEYNKLDDVEDVQQDLTTPGEHIQ
ncbi:hypothetical protein EDM53_00235 [Rickettsiales endosymbiont of Peranema trichophorum]|uniref:hypothetical protein n=1 Tax=Rickettsiales endosymbiont of Peranema trichophorum TaxID=2486577 RepID=UPI001022EB7C|nr:hypothetical protein [Rickettsiales endosymbiont of Peranema trichophorum]RZI47763.1 hypothetical protein EDM53_00235 [Rickettsiales endosymbiont of Peranema trichophorum]